MVTPGVVLGDRFRVGGAIGHGGMSDVYRAEDGQTGRPVAVKVLRGVGPEQIGRFAAEERVLAHLDHPAIVRLRGAGEFGGSPYLVLDLVEGRSLAEVLADGPIGPDRAAALGAVVADALAHAHAAGVVHRDVKPANILLGGDGLPRLADFGIAHLTGAAALTLTGTVLGTPHYLAPEQVAGEAVGPPADVYALGLVLLECITGRRAFDGLGPESAAARLARPPAVPPGLPRRLAALLAAMTTLDPAVRPRAAAVASRLRGDADHTTELPVVVPLAPSPRRRRWLAPVAAAVGVGALITGASIGARDTPGAAPTTTTTTAPEAAAVTLPPATAPTTTTTTAPAESHKGKDEDRSGHGHGGGQD